MAFPRILTRPAFCFLAVAMAFAAAGCRRSAPPAAADSAKPLTKVILQTDWYAEAEHGGFYQALLKGYYREAGLDVEILQGGPSTRPQQVVATGQADFAIGRSDDVIIFASRGVPLVMVGALMQRDPQALMFHHESGIRGFKDLDGRNIMAVPGSNFIPIIERIFHIKLSITPSDFGMSRFLADKNFVQQCFITNEPYFVRKQGANVETLLLSDSGFSPYRVWYARQRLIDEHPEVVRAFTAASIRGWQDYIAGDATATQARLTALNPKMEPDFLEYSLHTMQESKLVTGDPNKGEVVGQIRPERIAEQLRQLAEIAPFEHPVTLAEVFDGRFLPAEATAPKASEK
jgi:NitT/TauT family transport system substrate-binding protein